MRTVRLAIAIAGTLSLVAVSAAQDDGGRMYNTAKQKLMSGEGIVGVSISSPDPDSYCAAANAGFDFTWIEMQHSPLTYQDVARMLWACRDASAIPFIRVPDATEGDIQKAVDLGALGIVVPMVRTAEKMERAVRFAKFPPEGGVASAAASTARSGAAITGPRRTRTSWSWR